MLFFTELSFNYISHFLHGFKNDLSLSFFLIKQCDSASITTEI